MQESGIRSILLQHIGYTPGWIPLKKKVQEIHIVLDGNTLHIVLDMNIGATLINQEYFSCFDGLSRQFITDVFPDLF